MRRTRAATVDTDGDGVDVMSMLVTGSGQSMDAVVLWCDPFGVAMAGRCMDGMERNIEIQEVGSRKFLG